MAVLVPVDGSGPARRAATVTFRESPDAEFLVLYVIDPYRAVVAGGLEDVDSSMDRAQADAETALRVIEDLATDAGVDVETEIGFGSPARVILEYAALDETDRVVIGTHGRRGVERALLGSVTERVVRRSPVPVTVVK